MSSQSLQLQAHSTNELGQSLADVSQLDNHYRMCKTEYDRAIASVGIKPGWHVLDAGCGNGVFLPQIVNLVETSGYIVALDHSAENIAFVERWIHAVAPKTSVETKVAEVTELPLETNRFDCTWCANVSQYLSDDAWRQALSEFARVTKPNGLVAIKEVDISLWQWFPVDMRLTWRLLDAASTAGITQFAGCMRSWNMSKWMREQGMDIVSREGMMTETQQLSPTDIPYLVGVFRWFASMANDLALSDLDKAEWRRLSDDAEAILSDSDFLYRQMFTLTIGRVEA